MGRSTENGHCKLEACSFDSRIVRTRRLLLGLVALVALILSTCAYSCACPVRTRAGLSSRSTWLTRFMDDGSVDVVEDIQVDFGSLQKHGIFRDLVGGAEIRRPSCTTCKPGDEYNRVYKVSIAGVDDGQRAWPYERLGKARTCKSRSATRTRRSRGRSAIASGIGCRERLTPSRPRRVLLERDRRQVAGADREGYGRGQRACHKQGNVLPGPRVDAAVQQPAQRQPATFATTRRLSSGEELTIVVGMPKGA